MVNESLGDQNPYKRVTTFKKIYQAALEGPSGFASVVRDRLQLNNPNLPLAGELIRKSISLLPREVADEANLTGEIKVENYLARGYESSVLLFSTDLARWVAKIGHSQGFARGLFSPSSSEYAQMQQWNYAVLEKVYSPYLPQLLPRPYFIFSPKQLDYPSTVQLTPFIEKVTDIKGLTRKQRYNLWQEKLLFTSLSQELLVKYKVLPDLVKPSNLNAGLVGNEPHLVLFDMGLFNFFAPIPLLNILGYSAFKLTILKNRVLSRRFS